MIYELKQITCSVHWAPLLPISAVAGSEARKAGARSLGTGKGREGRGKAGKGQVGFVLIFPVCAS